MDKKRSKRIEMALAIIALLLGAAVVGMWAKDRPGDHPAANAAPPASPATASPTLSAEMRNRLVGRWLRPDGGYILTIDRVSEDGQAAASYANPRPIHVARAEVSNQAGRVALYVELRDRGYPGSYYKLVYDAEHDQLAGQYHHLGLNQVFDISFERLPKEVTATR